MTKSQISNHKSQIFLFLTAACLAACSRQEKFVEQRYQMHTVVEIQVLAPKSEAAATRAAMAAAFDAMAKVERELSWFEEGNDLARIRAAAPGTVVPVSQWTWDSLVLARGITSETDGLYDVCAGPIIRLWGFGPKATKSVPTDAEIKEALAHTGSDNLVMIEGQHAVSSVVAGVDVDLSSLAAGFAVDRASEALLSMGCSNFLVNGGGEIRSSSTGGKTWRIGIQVPAEDAAVDVYFPDRVIALKNGSVSTSGSYRNFFKAGTNAYAHIVNPKTGVPIKSETVSVTSWSTNCTLADAWSTALFTLPASNAVALADAHADVSCLIVLSPEKGGKKFRFIASKKFGKEL